ncbi:MAG TPA: hypothetical protein VHW45_02315, partial [Candidatus Sulfotelmatobacter sp.]|nr:hypothetical protein [Candidatus Sulfotelmatobacter sp.]
MRHGKYPYIPALVALVASLHATSIAQTLIYGGATKPTVIFGDTTITIINAAANFTRIYVVFPPATGNNNANFKSSVMTQGAIDGVTLQVPWSQIEATAPTQTDCTTSLPPDQCQPDPMASGWFHTYSWTSYDNNTASNPCTGVANTSSQWFCDFPNGSGSGYKQVNFQLFGISSDPNSSTPSYVTTNTSYIAATGSGVTTQDVVNVINSPGCTEAYAGSNTVPIGTQFVGSGSSIQVNWSGNPFIVGDIIWVSGVGNTAGHMFDVTGVQGKVISAANTSSFTYAPASGTATGTVTIGTPGVATVVNNTQSWPIPYENPYSSAWQSFLAAAIYHFNNLNSVSSGTGGIWHLRQTASQIAYIRPGIARGGEALPVCPSSPPMATPSSPFSGYTDAGWEMWYTTVVAAVQAARPQMQIMYSINMADPAHPSPLVPTAEAGFAVGSSGVSGLYNGFGSQGLAQSDTAFLPSSCPQLTGIPNTGNNWGCMFNYYWSGAIKTTAKPTTVPLELQQVDCSNPCTATSATCSQGTVSDTCFHGGPPGQTEDLRTLYPFATSNYASILELYSQDALLAFDPKFCILSGGSCDLSNAGGGDSFGTSLSAATQYGFFQYVGIGKGTSGTSTCAATYNQTPQTGSTGDCS